MPFKHHASRRHKFAKSKHRVTNWSEYSESLRRRADITVWIDESVVHRWGMARTGKRGQPGRYSDLAITVCLQVWTVFHFALWQTQGFLRSVFQLLGMELVIPDFSTLSRRDGGLEPLPRARSEAPGWCCQVKSVGVILGRHSLIKRPRLQRLSNVRWRRSDADGW
ncbi:hypothetical protein FMN63_03330 [Stappia sp. BW2]|uniref:transposase n=1 Tax=Stappia sp. BW2 TaxID=2592622 RepID=UPI0011DEFEFF|nr:transposase [Stappia sp. BW2]TYC78304.1 hypothetical protein FMN63_03330 [Stappia sp. BW2]